MFARLSYLLDLIRVMKIEIALIPGAYDQQPPIPPHARERHEDGAI